MDTGNVLIYDEEESRMATERQMAESARRFGIGGNELPPMPNVPMPMPPANHPIYAPEFPAIPMPMPMPPANHPIQVMPTVIPDHLLITPSGREGMVRLVHMRGPDKLEGWTLSESAASVVISMLHSFGITATDLREEDC